MGYTNITKTNTKVQSIQNSRGQRPIKRKTIEEETIGHPGRVLTPIDRETRVKVRMHHLSPESERRRYDGAPQTAETNKRRRSFKQNRPHPIEVEKPNLTDKSFHQINLTVYNRTNKSSIFLKGRADIFYDKNKLEDETSHARERKEQSKSRIKSQLKQRTTETMIEQKPGKNSRKDWRASRPTSPED
ncbi:hypothetical protein Bca4012_090901 [Brassica carinata]